MCQYVVRIRIHTITLTYGRYSKDMFQAPLNYAYICFTLFLYGLHHLQEICCSLAARPLFSAREVTYFFQTLLSTDETCEM